MRLYRLLLRLAPPRLRDLHGREMEQLFEERRDEARRRGPLAVAAVYAAAALDLLRARRTGRRSGATARRDPRRSDVMIGADLRGAWRAVSRQSGASLLVVAMLTLGIAANVAVFSLVNGLFLRPLPFPQPDRLVYINTSDPSANLDTVGINYPDFVQWQKGQRAFEAMAAYSATQFNLSDKTSADRVDGALVTRDFFRVFGVAPILGRTFTPDEDAPKGPAVALISASLWRSRFGADPDIVGRSLRLDGAPHTIVGVMPDRASFPTPDRIWVPMQGDPAQAFFSYDGDAFARMKPGVTVGQAEADLLRAHQAVWDTTDKRHLVTPYVRGLRESIVRDFRGLARIVSGAVAVLLLIACANVAAVMLARALARRREMGIRLALGSTRTRLLRQLLLENLLLAAVGGALGAVGGTWTLGALMRLVPDQFPSWADFSLDARVAAFAAGTVVLTVVLFGWAPALHAIGGALRHAVHATTNGTTAAPRGRRTLGLLVGAEFALAALLLVSGGLLVKAFERVREVDPGFRADHELVAAVALSEGTRPKPEQWRAFWAELETRVERLPGVESVGLISCAPMAGCHNGNFFEAEGARPRPDGSNPVVLTTRVTPGYFAAIGIRLRSGRFLQDADNQAKAVETVVVNETFVRTFWGQGADGTGRRIRFGATYPWMTVVGVTDDVKHYGLEKPMRPQVYIPTGPDPSSAMTIVVHTSVPPASIAPSIRRGLRQIDPEVPLYRPRTMDQLIAQSLALRNAFSWMLAVFAGLAFLLAVGGAYGVASYLVTQRAREIGIRVALGAASRDVFRAAAGRGLLVGGAGAAGGLALTPLLPRILGDALFGVKASDPSVLAGVSLVLLATALAANGLPARKAARVDPMRSLRTEG